MHSPTVANVPDAESEYHAHEFLDATVQPKPIYISPNEVYAMHGLLSKHLDDLVSRSDGEYERQLIIMYRLRNATTLCARSSRSWAACLIWALTTSSTTRARPLSPSSLRTAFPTCEVCGRAVCTSSPADRMVQQIPERTRRRFGCRRNAASLPFSVFSLPRTSLSP
jgi:hypothetical protein